METAKQGGTLDLTVEDGLLLHYTPSPKVQPRMCVPVGRARVRLSFEAHDAHIAGHLGRDKMAEALRRHHTTGLGCLILAASTYILVTCAGETIPIRVLL